ncbi:hypothetical protein DNH61_02970 [Paenibacillus sambharensis]|uniref:Uncharacterized protein n=1 Tax=Paenibacillus sambharensis TaxID=1803190 RepID=A0A2W1LAQ2_9BACL|nr:hypothetical protein [Paenibacillus sambharensis]PZD97328.1 hypothetical protein DNH61_02970 [Paenibacillus sambharensis]
MKKWNRRIAVESLLFPLVVYLVYTAYQGVSGYLMTMYYVPDIVNEYESVDYLQHKVSFGEVYRFEWGGLAGSLLAWLILSLVYYIVRYWWKFKRQL